MQIAKEGEQIFDLIKKAEKIGVLANVKSGVDGFCAALAFFHILKKLDKRTVFIFSEEIPPGCKDLPGAEKTQKDLGPQDLVISFDAKDAPVEKVSYSKEEGTFNLLLHPISRNFDLKKIRYSFLQEKFDLFVILGAESPKDLGEIYLKNEGEFKNAKIINIDISEKNASFGNINVVDLGVSSLSLLLFLKLSSWKLKPDKETAQALLFGLSQREKS